MTSTVATASTNFFLAAAENRCSCYTLTNSSPISDTRIRDIVASAVKHSPSAFNIQSTRAVVLVKQDHETLWDFGDAALKNAMPEQAYAGLASKVQGFRAAYGTVLWFEDQSALDALKQKNPVLQHVIPQWSSHSSGMAQLIVWAALELEGLGCNLQHYNFMSEFREKVRNEWNIPETWALHSQLVFGAPLDGLKRSRERTYLPLEDRVKMYGGD
ncbi:uncharacterized protein Z519_05480 [Cladophialophora bantiana CBS 173.52]|uniref:Nitroreductase domain-containing protein n=1 Tax=Cladophialophora bantiana (strain ATCC 10958 / CBS 173.52 / CDC B-1940 / NIH 8579) TaxID=1442370 RepID=A0A0D2IBG4_CLAB1|nr:uncharacterized protein Z519_05480 [Cladophialophora bantiana CBS 173.52]KIW94164.1 hypothetical protein Z519_05480 [Cladophialophora bantiana CBS 173.52]